MKKLFVILVVFSLGAAQARDFCSAYTATDRRGDEHRLHLPDPGKTWPLVSNQRVASNRRLGDQRHSSFGKVYKSASSFYIHAGKTPVTLYLYEGDNLDGRMLRWTCPQGQDCTMHNSGWFDDRLGSLTCVREIEPKNSLEKLDHLVIPLESVVSKVRHGFDRQLGDHGKIEEHKLLDTQVSATSYTTAARETGLATPGYWDKYRDLLRIYQKIEIDPEWWVSNYDASVKMYFEPRLIDGEMRFEWRMFKTWVEDGTFRNKIRSNLSSAVGGSIADTAEQLTEGIRDGVYEGVQSVIEGKFGESLAKNLWTSVRAVALENPCKPFNSLSGFSQPASPTCWAYGSDPKMFPPTLKLYRHRSLP